MDKQHPNVILFDEDEAPPTPTHKPISKVVHNEIRELTNKVKQL